MSKYFQVFLSWMNNKQEGHNAVNLNTTADRQMFWQIPVKNAIKQE